jgi:hypothetical protein
MYDKASFHDRTLPQDGLATLGRSATRSTLDPSGDIGA